MANAEKSANAAARIPTKQDLLNLLKICDDAQGKINTLSGEMGAAVADKAEKKNLNKKAFGLMRQMRKMDQSKLASFLTHFDHYREVLEIDKLAGEPLIPENVEDAANEAAAAAGGKKKKNGAAAGGGRKRRSGKDAAAEQGAGDEENEDNVRPFRSIGEAGDRAIAEANKRLNS